MNVEVEAFPKDLPLFPPYCTDWVRISPAYASGSNTPPHISCPKGHGQCFFFHGLGFRDWVGLYLTWVISQRFGYPALFASCAVSGFIALLIFMGFVRRTLLHGKEEHIGNIHQSS